MKPACKAAGGFDGPGALAGGGAVDIVGPVDTVEAGGRFESPESLGPIDTVAAGGLPEVLESLGPVATVAAGGLPAALGPVSTVTAGGTTGALEALGAAETGGIIGTVKVLLLLPGGGGTKGPPKISSHAFLLDLSFVLESALDGSSSDFDLGSSGIRIDILRSRALGR